MNRPEDRILVNGATSQLDRWLRALDGGYAQVDGRSFAQLLAFAPRFAGLIQFYGLDDRADGDWTEFFVTDPTLVLASVAAADPQAAAAELDRLAAQVQAAGGFERKLELLAESFATVLDLGRQIDQWLRGLDRNLTSEPARRLRREVRAAVRGDLGEQMRTLESYDRGAGDPEALGQPVGLDFGGFLPVWGLGEVPADGSIYRGSNRRQRIDHALPQLRPILDTLVRRLADWRPLAEANLEASLDASDHRPQLALFIAFARLFRHAQAAVNTFSDRYSNFYYREVLRERERGPVPDSLYLTFTPTADLDVAGSPVPAGTLFPAGEDEEGNEILYAADRGLTVTAAALEVLRTVRAERGGLLLADGDAGENGRAVDGHGDDGAGDPPSPVNRRILSSEITPGGEPWRTFGAALLGPTESQTTESQIVESQVTEVATLGFAVASPYLWLAGGHRTVTLAVRFAAGDLHRLLSRLSAATGLGVDGVFRRVLARAFELFVSTADGWLPVASYRVVSANAPPDGPGELALRFELPPEAPAVAPYDPDGDSSDDGASVSEDDAVNASNPDPTSPTLKVYLRQEPVLLKPTASTDESEAAVLGATDPPPPPPPPPPLPLPPAVEGEEAHRPVRVYPLSLLGDLDLEDLRLRTDVAGLSELDVENTDGVVDTDSPFPAFGAAPVVGSYLRLYQRELFLKRLDALQLDLAWFGLPTDETGFKGYYRDYVIGQDGKEQPDLFDNRSFQVAIDVRSPGNWTLSPPTPAETYLFRTRDDCRRPVPTPDGALCPDTAFDDLTVAPAEPSPYYDPSDGAVELVLSEPPYGFGSGIYAENVLNAVIDDLPDADRCQVQCEAECGVLQRAADCIDACLLCLGTGEGADAAPQAVAPKTCLEGCEACLAGILVECLNGCLPSVDAAADAEMKSFVKTRVDLCLAKEGEERRTAMEGLLVDLRLALGTEEVPTPGDCWHRCEQILGALSCVLSCSDRCRDEDGELDPQCLIPCLGLCLSRLRSAYDQCMEACASRCMTPKNELRYPNEPFLPQLAGLSLTYSANCRLDGEACADFYLLWPFGGTSSPTPSDDGARPLLPRFPDPGNLYLGFSGLTSPQDLTLFFQMAAPDGRNLVAELPPVTWGYLADNCWNPLGPRRLLADTTDGLSRTGIATLRLPDLGDAENTLLSGDLQWLRATAPRRPGRFPETAAITPHASTATWALGTGGGEHLRQGLPAGTITGSVDDLPGVESIDQPLPSFGGRPAETRRPFEIRVGERLRHKHRAVLGWDYERLVLERFPEVWKVQALPARSRRGGGEPGSVLVVVVPDNGGAEVPDPTAPGFPTDVLDRIQAFLRRSASPFVDLTVSNPVYVRIEVSAAVRFTEDSDPGANIDRLDRDLVEYLSPGFYDAERAAKRGAYVDESDIADFVQTRPYVETVESLGFRYRPSPAALRSDWIFLTSARSHDIRDAEEPDTPPATCY